MSSTDPATEGSDAGEHAEQAIRALYAQLASIRNAPWSAEDAETMKALTRAIGDLQGSVLWARRHRPEHGGRMQHPPSAEAIRELGAFRADALELLRSDGLRIGQFAHACGILGSNMYAEYDGEMIGARDLDTLATVHDAWRALQDRRLDMGQAAVIRYLANTAVSLSNHADNPGSSQGVTRLFDILDGMGLTADQLTESRAAKLADFFNALLYYELIQPWPAARNELSIWPRLDAAPWRDRMLDLLSWEATAGLMVTGANVLGQQGDTDAGIPWRWLRRKLEQSTAPDTTDEQLSMAGRVYAELIVNDSLAADEVQWLQDDMLRRVRAAGPAANARFGDGATFIGFSLPHARPLSTPDRDLLEAALTAATELPDYSAPRAMISLVGLLVHDGLHCDWDRVSARLSALMAPPAWQAAVSRIVAYRAIAELALMPDLPESLRDAFVAIVVEPFEDAGSSSHANEVEAARLLAIERLLARPESDVHPSAFFPLIGLDRHE